MFENSLHKYTSPIRKPSIFPLNDGNNYLHWKNNINFYFL